MAYPFFLDKEVLVLGCGNTLMGDDGFGPCVVSLLENLTGLQQYAAFIDAGTCARDFLFDLLLSDNKKVKHLFVIDAVRRPDLKPGDIFKMDIDQIPDDKSNDFFVHQFPGSNLLTEISQTAGITVHLYVVQAENIPDRICPGLSLCVEKAVQTLADRLDDRIRQICESDGIKGVCDVEI